MWSYDMMLNQTQIFLILLKKKMYKILQLSSYHSNKHLQVPLKINLIRSLNFIEFLSQKFHTNVNRIGADTNWQIVNVWNMF